MNKPIKRHMMTLDYGIVKLTGKAKAKPSGVYIQAQITRGRQPGWRYRVDWIPADNFV